MEYNFHNYTWKYPSVMKFNKLKKVSQIIKNLYIGKWWKKADA